MRAKTFVGIAMFLVLMSYSSAQSQQRPFSNARPVQQPTAQDQRGTDQVGEAKEILTLKNALWFYGYVAHDDTFGFGRELRYIFRYDGSTGGRFRLHSFQEFQSRIRHEDDTSRSAAVDDLSRGGPEKEDLPLTSGHASSPWQ